MEKKQRTTRIKITKRALFQRINRKLKQSGEKLCTARNETVRGQLGEAGSHPALGRTGRGKVTCQFSSQSIEITAANWWNRRFIGSNSSMRQNAFGSLLRPPVRPSR